MKDGSEKRTLIVVCASAVLYHIMVQGTRPLVSLFGAQLGATAFEIGVLSASYSVLAILVTVPAGRMADRFGYRLPLLGGAVLACAGLGFPWFFPVMWALYASQVLVGLSQVFIHLSLQNVVGYVSPKSRRDTNFAWLSTSMSLGGLIGPPLGGWFADAYGYPLSFAGSMGLGLIPLALALLVPAGVAGAAGNAPASRQSSWAILKRPPLNKVIFASGISLTTRDLFVMFFPLIGAEHGLSATMIGLILTMQSMAVLAIRFFLPLMTRYADRGTLLFAAIFISGTAFLLVPFWTSVTGFMILAVLAGFEIGFGQPLTMTITYNLAPENQKGIVQALRFAVNRTVLIVAPLTVGVFGVFGTAALFIGSGLYLMAGALATKVKEPAEWKDEAPSV